MPQSYYVDEAKRLLDPTQWAIDRSLRTAQLYRGREVAHHLRAHDRSDLALPLEAPADAMRPLGTSVNR
jgi:hypothetical protein